MLTIIPPNHKFCRPSECFEHSTVLFSQKLALSKRELEYLYRFAPDFPAAGRASRLLCGSAVFSDEEGERNGSLRSTLDGFRVAKVRWQQSIADCAAKPDTVWLRLCLGLRIPFAYLIVQIQIGPGLEEDPFLQGSVYSEIIVQTKVLSLSRPFRPAEMPPTACPVSWVVKFTSCAVRPGGEHLMVSTAVSIDELLKYSL